MMPRWARPALPLSRDKADTLLLMLSSVLVLAPHGFHLPLWITAVVTATLLWRASITFSGTRLPPRWLLLPVAVLAMAGVYATFRTLLGRDAGVAMLALLLAFKLLEMHARRDLFVIVFLSFFLLLTNFFYSQSIATALTMCITIILLLAAQLSFQYTGTVPSLARRLRLAASMFALAAPLALLLFIGFPRIQGPLWGLPGDAKSGRSGLSESMAPGNLSSLVLSDEVAFRVRFDGPVPPQNKLYWRAIVLSNYDGRNWTRLGPARLEPARLGSARLGPARLEPARLGPARSGATAHATSVQLRGAAVRYQVTLEPVEGRWMPALEVPERMPGMDAALTAELELFGANPIGERVRYDLTSFLSYSIGADASAEQLAPWLSLPSGFNPRTVAWARSLQQTGNPGAAIEAVLKAFHDGQFSYTLEPPLLGRDGIDDFLFESKAGFCEHYSSAFVVIMRAMQIPARVVTGYQGGELNPIDGFLTVRQSDAHAWAEVWLAGRGWVRVDPTAAVAPERIARSLARALPRTAPFGLQALGNLIDNERFWVSQWRFNVNALNNAWNQWVLDYTPQRQRSVLQTLAAALGHWQSLLGGALMVGLIFGARRLLAQRAGDPADALYLAFCGRMAQRGCVRLPCEGPLGYAARVAELADAPQQKVAMAAFLHLYSAIKYGPIGPVEKIRAVTTLKNLFNQSR